MSIESVVQLERRVEALEAQLAALVARIAVLEQVNSDIELPEDCRLLKCDYAIYLGGGPAELTHQQYHTLEKSYDTHAEQCNSWTSGRACAICTSYERQLRA